MPDGKFKFSYDEEYDTLAIYSQVKRASYGMEWGDIDISYDSKGNLVSLQFNNASRLLSNLTKRKVTNKLLKQISDCRMRLKESAGILYVTFKLCFKAPSKPLEDTLALKALSYQSPVTAAG